MQFECGTRILRVNHGRDARATPSNCTTTPNLFIFVSEPELIARRRFYRRVPRKKRADPNCAALFKRDLDRISGAPYINPRRTWCWHETQRPEIFRLYLPLLF